MKKKKIVYILSFFVVIGLALMIFLFNNNILNTPIKESKTKILNSENTNYYDMSNSDLSKISSISEEDISIAKKESGKKKFNENFDYYIRNTTKTKDLEGSKEDKKYIELADSETGQIKKVDSKIINNIYPVAYFEKNIGSKNYKTKTVLLQDKKNIELETHYRTFSKTYPVSAVGDINKSRELNGQILSYYNSIDGVIYLYNKAYSIDGANNLLLTNKEKEVLVEYEDDEDFFDLLYFGDYYICSFINRDDSDGDYGAIKLDVFSKDLKRKNLITIDLKKLGISVVDIINTSLVVTDDYVIIPIENNGRFYLLHYNIRLGKSELKEKDYRPIGLIYQKDYVYTIGYKGNNLIVEKADDSGKIYSEDIIDLKTILKSVESNIRFDNTLYMWNDKIYGCYYDDNNSKWIYFLYNVEKNSVSKICEIDRKKDFGILMDSKYMVSYNGNFFDMYPHFDNSQLIGKELKE